VVRSIEVKELIHYRIEVKELIHYRIEVKELIHYRTEVKDLIHYRIEVKELIHYRTVSENRENLALMKFLLRCEAIKQSGFRIELIVETTIIYVIYNID
jgi:hypothetical protein